MRPDFLIIGMERSGSLWTSATLNAHPEIASFPFLPFQGPSGELRPGEMHFFNTLASIDGDDPARFTRPIEDWAVKYQKVFADLVPYKNKISKTDFIAMAVRRYSEYCDRQRGGKKIVGESTPAYVFHLERIDSLYPDIKKICVIRDPKDKIVSWHFSLLGKGRKKEKKLTPDFALNYLHERIIKEYEALLEYNGVTHCVTYEKMTHVPEDTIRGMLEYLGMDADQGIIKAMIRESSFSSMTLRHSKDRARERGEEEVRDSLRKGVVGDFRNHMSEELVRTVDDIVTNVRTEVFKKYNVIH